MPLLAALLCAHIFIAIFGTHGINSSHGPVQWMNQWVWEHDDLVYLKCRNILDDSGNVLMRTFARKYTTWSHLRDFFNEIYMENMYLNTRTLLVSAKASEGNKACISLVAAARQWYLVDTVTLTYENHQPGEIRGLVAHRGRGSAGTVVSFPHKMEVLEPDNVKAANVGRFPRKCPPLESGPHGRWKSSLEGCEISFGCYPNNDYKGPSTTCEQQEYIIMHSVLHALNATPQFRFYARYNSLSRDLDSGRVDISLKMGVLGPASFRRHAFPRVLEYSHEKFYTWTGEKEQSFLTTVIHSKAVMGFVIATFVLAFLALCLGEFLELGRHFDGSVVMNFATFLFATFLATSFPIPQKRGRSKFRWHARSQATVIFVWMLGIFPLSFYLRGEVTSRLSIAIPPNPIDTIDELEKALDTGQLAPCLVRREALHFLLNIRKEELARLNNIDRKLKLAFDKKGSPLTYSHPFDCLRSCATKPGFACITYAYDSCPQRTYTRGYAVSRDSLRLAFAYIPVRKDFERAKAYENLLARIFETGLDIYSSNSRIQCDRKLAEADVDPEWSKIEDEKETSQVFKLSMFFASFCAALSFASTVFCLEVAIGSKRCAQARNLNQYSPGMRGVTPKESTMAR